MRCLRSLMLLAAAGLFLPPGIGSAAEKGTAPAAATPKAPRVHMPKEFKYAGQIHPKGAYALRVDVGGEGPFVVLMDKSGAEVARELAIVQPRKTKAHGVLAAVELLRRDEHMVRVIVREGEKRYLAYFETNG